MTTTWKVTRSEEVAFGKKEKGRFVVFDNVPECEVPGMFVTMRAKGSEVDMEGLTLVSTVGEKAAVFLSPMRRVSAALSKALSTVGEELEVSAKLFGHSTLSSTDTTPYFLLNCGVTPLATTPLVSLLRWDIPKDNLIPKVLWVVYSPEDLNTVHACLKSLDKKEAKRCPLVTIILAGSHNNFSDHIAVIEDIKSRVAAGCITYKVSQTGSEEFPSMVKALCTKHNEKQIGIELFGSRDMFSQLKVKIPLEWGEGESAPVIKFGNQKSFGYCVPKQKNRWVEYEPWPVTSWLPPFCFLPWGVGRSTMGFQEWLFVPTDPLPLALFRAIFGLLIASYGVRALTDGRVWRDHVWADMRFKYDYIEFMGPDIPPPYCYYVYAVMSLSGFCLMIGWPYRLAALTYTMTAVWHFFVEATHYNNHYYLMFTLGFIFMSVDANACLVFNPVEFVRRRLKGPQKAKTDDGKVEYEVPKVAAIPYLHHWVLRGFILFVFFYGFVAKLNNDWISGHVMRAGLEDELPHWLIVEFCVFFLAWGGLIFDGAGPLFLCHNPLRFPTLCIFTFFNISNMIMFNIGIFPWMMLGCIPLLTETHTPRRQIRSLAERAILLKPDKWYKRLAIWTGNKVLPHFPAFTDGVYKLFLHETHYSQPNGIMRPSKPALHPKYSRPHRAMLTLLMMVFIVFHFGFPLRSWVYHMGTNQQVAWTEHGRKFSWHMMSRHKNCTGYLLVKHDLMKLELNVSINQAHYTGPLKLNSHQLKKLTTIPTYVRQLAWKTRKAYERKYITNGFAMKIDPTDDEAMIRDRSKAIRIYANVMCSVNGHPKQPFIDPSYDLSRQLPPQPPGVREPWILNQTRFGVEGYPDMFPRKLFVSID